MLGPDEIARGGHTVLHDIIVSRPAQIKSLLKGLKFNKDIALAVMKVALAPVIIICLTQSTVVLNYFQTNFYISAIVAALSSPIHPTAKLIEDHLRLAIALGISYSFALFAAWCGLQARIHTTNENAQLSDYNTSAEVVVAVFLILAEWVIFTIKSAFPPWNTPCALAGIFACVTYPGLAGQTNMSDIINSASITVEIFLMGQAFALAVGLVVFPLDFRTIFFKDFKRCLLSIKEVIKKKRECMCELERLRKEPNSVHETLDELVDQLKTLLQSFAGGVLKLQSDLQHTRHELSWSRYKREQLQDFVLLLVDLVPPLSGLAATADMIRQLSSHQIKPHEQAEVNLDSHLDHKRSQELNDWHQLEAEIVENSYTILAAMTAGVEHALIQLELVEKPHSDNQTSSANTPGNVEFIRSYNQILEKVGNISNDSQGDSGEKLFRRYIKMLPKYNNDPRCPPPEENLRYFVQLHIQGLVVAAATELEKVLLCIDDSRTNHKHLAIPLVQRMKRMIRSVFSPFTHHVEGKHVTRKAFPAYEPAFWNGKDPDHLPPTTLVERIGDNVRRFSRVLHNEHTIFGIRGACAVMTIAVIAFLPSSKNFYSSQRFIWALFSIILSFSRTAGTSTFSLIMRLAGTFASMIACYITWYAVDGKTAGVIVLFSLWLCVLGYLIIVFSRFYGAWIVALIAAVVMIGNELENETLGLAKVRATGLAVYPPYVIFPYRLAVISIGVTVAYFWTIFPYPLSEHRGLRIDVAESMHTLASNYTVIQKTISMRIAGTVGDINNQGSPNFRLYKNRLRLFRTFRTQMDRARQRYTLLDWEFTPGGRFPKKTFREVIAVTERLATYITLIGYVSRSFESWWLSSDTAAFREHINLEGVVTRLLILHSALSRAHPLPAELYDLRLDNLNGFFREGVPAEEGFAAAALIHSVNWFLLKDVNLLQHLVGELVGVIDISADLPPVIAGDDTLTAVETINSRAARTASESDEGDGAV